MLYVVEKARDITKQQDMQISISHYLHNMAKLTNQFNETTYKAPNRQRLYLKDIDCPPEWHDHLKEIIPPGIFYLNETTGEVGGPGSIEEPNLSGPGTSIGKGPAKAGDLMSSLLPEMRADNMQCYIGHEGTYTPAHREMCASLGQNLMVEASGTVDEYGAPSRPGSSIWFMTESKHRHLVSEYWSSTLGHDIEVESYFAHINAWRAAPFKTYITEQKPGDFILIPPLATHQVWNRGTRTMKVAWNRTTVETLEMALNEALPRARIVCRDEQYKNKAIVLFTLEKYSKILDQVNERSQTAVDLRDRLDATYAPKIRQLHKDFKRLFALYNTILLSEMLPTMAPTEKRATYLPYDSYITCSYCRCNIFNRFLTCTSCIIPLEEGEEDTYDICMECFAMGRSCKCISRYTWVEQFPWQDLTEKHEHWRLQVMRLDGEVTEESPQSLQVQRRSLTKKTLAHVCYEQLKVRPWCDPEKQHEPPQEEELPLKEDLVNDTSTGLRRRKKGPSLKMQRGFQRCHISQRLVPKWKLALCKCGRVYHYGTLFRAFDEMPLTIMENPDWQCPFCRKICSCGACRKRPEMQPFEPSRTMLGLDTKEFADPRSIDGLLDFSHSNIGWIKKSGDDDPYETRRLRRLKDEAAYDKSTDSAPDLDGYFVNSDEYRPGHGQHPEFMPMNSQHRKYMPMHSQYLDSGITANEQDPDLSIDPLLLQPVQVSPSTPNKSTIDKGDNGWHAVNTHPEPVVGTGEHPGNNQYLNPDGHQSQRLVALASYVANPDFHSGPYTPQEHTGSNFQYPDPTLSQFTPSPPTNHFKKLSAIAHFNDHQDNVKRKRVSDTRDRVQSDLQPPAKKVKDSPRSPKFSTLEDDNIEKENSIIAKPEEGSPMSWPTEFAQKRKHRVNVFEKSPPRKKLIPTRTSLPRDARRTSVNYAEIPPEPYSPASPTCEGGKGVSKESRTSSARLVQRKSDGSIHVPKSAHHKPTQLASDQSPTHKVLAEPFDDGLYATVDPSMLGPVEVTVGVDASTEQADEIREAELRALLWSDDEGSLTDYSSSQPDTQATPVRMRDPAAKGAGGRTEPLSRFGRPPKKLAI